MGYLRRPITKSTKRLAFMIGTYTGKRKREPLRLVAGAATAARRYGQNFLRRRPAKRSRGAVPSSQNTLSQVSNLSRLSSSVSEVLRRPTRRGVEQQEGANSITKCNFGKFPCYVPKSVLRALAPQIHPTNGDQKYTTSIGLQDAVSIPWNTASTLYGYLSGVTDKMIYHSFNGELMMVNSSSTNSCLTFYDIICKKDCPTSAVSDPLNAWLNGVDQAGGTATDYKVIGSIPSESLLFNEYYKIVQTTPISLAPGEFHRHVVKFEPNKIVSAMYLNNVQYGIGGLSCHTLIVHHGMPAHDSTTTTSVTIDVSDLDVVTKNSHNWRLLESATTVWSKTNNLPTSFAVGEQFVNEAVGQVQDAGGLHPGTLHT